jgi:serine/threonine-protein kinase
VDDDRVVIEESFPTGPSIAPSRAAFNAQMRVEIYLATRATADALTALADADANGLVDVVWLERCPLLAPLRGAPAWRAVLRSASLRAERVREALEG